MSRVLFITINPIHCAIDGKMAAPLGNGITPGPPAGFPMNAPGAMVLPPLAPNWSEHRGEIEFARLYSL